ncbi:MAG: SH3 domain-containing protein [Thermosynechococcus sp. Uc]|uniref:SH3 domain-containing protein n=1 Tax=Thermosynechococcus sp. Uc TaxID=3034853 RepID=UPI0019ED2055|nr:SH3 domain-containing protein [Thermosynechococcus sp. Uc]MDM7326290.1 SH3 domain-containing protein [Thermosynechococcus sp. Uc]HIK25054.1 SH3 domain-containing protein [Thermosynechococcus sp. M46_R2017_013]
MKPVVRVLQWLLGTFLGFSLIALVAAAIITPFVFNLLWLPPRPNVEAQSSPDPVEPVPNSTSPPPEPSPTPSPPMQPEGRVIYGDGLRLRDRPSREANTLGGVAFDEVVTILERSEDGEWLKIRTKNNLEGWVLAFGVQETTAESPPSSETPR